MIVWGYRIMKHTADEEEHFAVHEVFYSDKGDVESWTADPISISGDSKQEVIASIKQMLGDCRQPVLVESKLLKNKEKNG